VCICIKILFFRGENVRLTLWGELTHCLNEDLMRKQAIVIVTATMVVNSRFQGNYMFIISHTYIYGAAIHHLG
jgi:hypothetical protein